MENNTKPTDLKEFFKIIWKRKIFIGIVALISLVAGIIVAFTTPAEYQAGCTIVPQNGQKGAGNLSGLASMMGVNIDANVTTEDLSPTVYSKILRSAPFCKEIMKTNIVVKKTGNQPITLYDYYSDRKYQKKSLLDGIKKYTIRLPATIRTSKNKGKNAEKITFAITDSITNKIITLTSSERRVVEAIKQNIYFSHNQKDGYISLGYTFAEPEAVAIISQRILDVLEKYVKTYKSKQQVEKLQFIEKSYAEARKDFVQKQANLAAYQDESFGLVSARGKAVEKRLESDYDIAFTVYNELAKQLEQAKISVRETMPALAVIEPVVLPQERSAPKRIMIMAVFAIVGLVLGISWVLAEPFFKEIIDEIREEKATKFTE